MKIAEIIAPQVARARRQAYGWAAWRLWMLVSDMRDKARDPRVVLAAVTDVMGELDNLEDGDIHAWVTHPSGGEDRCQHCGTRRRDVKRYDEVAGVVDVYEYMVPTETDWRSEDPRCQYVAADIYTNPTGGSALNESATAVIVAMALQPGLVLSDEDRDVLRRYLKQRNQ